MAIFTGYVVECDIITTLQINLGLVKKLVNGNPQCPAPGGELGEGEQTLVIGGGGEKEWIIQKKKSANKLSCEQKSQSKRALLLWK